jgi:integrase
MKYEEIKRIDRHFSKYQFYVWYNNKPQRKVVTLARKAVKQVFLQWVEEIQNPSPKGAKLFDIINEYLAITIKNRSKEQYEHIQRDLKSFCEFINIYKAKRSSDIGNEVELSDIKNRHVEQYKNWRMDNNKKKKGKPLAVSTMNRNLGSLKCFFNWCILNDYYFSKNPVCGNGLITKDPNVGAKHIDLTNEQLRLVLKCCTEKHLKIFLTIMSYTGLRGKEILRLKWTQFDCEAGVLHIKAKQVRKSLKSRYVKLPKGLVKYLNEQDRECEFIVSYKKKPIVNNVWRSWKSTKKVLIEHLKHEGADYSWAEILTPYKLKHNFITQMAKAGVPLKMVANHVGHSSTRITEAVYNHYHDGIDSHTLEDVLESR